MKKLFILAAFALCLAALAIQPAWSQSYKVVNHFGSLDGWGNSMRFPTGICLDEAQVPVKHDCNDRVKYIQKGYEKQCQDVAAKDSTKIYIADWDNHRVEKYDIDGHLLKRWGDQSPLKPYGTVLDKKGNLHTSCQYYDRIQKVSAKVYDQHTFAPQYWRYARIGTNPVSSCDDPRGMALDPNGNVVIADYGYRRIFVFDTNRHYISSFSTVVDGDRDLLSASDKKHMDPMPRPIDVAVDDQGSIFVCYNKNFGVRKFTSAGKIATDFPRDLKISGSDMILGGLALDKKGNIFVTDRSKNMVHKLNGQGNLDTSWGRFGYLPGYFNKPAGIKVDSKDRVYVVDQGNHRVQIFAR